MGKLRRLAAFAVLVLLMAAAAWWTLSTKAPTYPFETRTYVWQNAWTPEVGAAVARAASRNDGYLVLIGEVDGLATPLRLQPATVDWPALAKAVKPVTLTLRANRGLLEGRPLEETSQFLYATLQKRIASAKSAGVPVDGIQLDYDCPTARLPQYATLVKTLHKRLPDLPMSITALPTWLDSKAFKALIRETDYYVLQVHGLDKPTTIDAPIVLFDASKLSARLKRASKLKVPYFVALPTYGYRVAFDETGHFKSLGAENAPALPRSRTIMADPEELAKVVATLRVQQPAWCRGIAWFRLPVDGDTLNWSWPTLVSVMDGKVPTTLPSVELRHPAANLYEVWITNTAGYATDKPIAISLRWNGPPLQASDVLGAFEAKPGQSPGKMVIQGPSPAGNKPTMAAWLRVFDDTQGAPHVEKVQWGRPE